MKRFIALLFTLYAVLLQPLAANASYFPSTQITDNKETAYRASTPVFTTAASATDIFNFKGSGTKTIYIRKIVWKQANATGASHHVYLLKRSTANTGGTSSALTAVPLDSNFPSATASGVYYTANASSLGTSVGTIAHKFIRITYDLSLSLTLFDATKGGSPIVLRGTGESISVNYNGVTDAIGTSAAVDIEWSEK